MARCARQYDITHGQIPILYSHTFSRPAEGPSLLSHFTFLQFLLWFKSSVRLDVRSFYPLHAGDEALRAQRAEERAGARSTGLVVVTIEDYLAGARALCLRTAHREIALLWCFLSIVLRLLSRACGKGQFRRL